jgi:hypothetical protein
MLPLFVQPRRPLAYTSAPLQNREHGAGAFDLGGDADVCVVTSSSAVIAAGHGCGRDGLKPLGRRTFRSGWEVVGDHPEPTWRTPMLRDTTTAGGGASDGAGLAGQTSDSARCAVSSTGLCWRQGGAGLAVQGSDGWNVVDTETGFRRQRGT